MKLHVYIQNHCLSTTRAATACTGTLTIMRNPFVTKVMEVFRDACTGTTMYLKHPIGSVSLVYSLYDLS